jgi:hypothetical protein
MVAFAAASAARLDSIMACAGIRVSAAGLFHFAAFSDILVSPARFLDSLLTRQAHSFAQGALIFSQPPAT